MNFSILGIAIATGLQFFFLYTRKKEWARPKLRWSICGVLFSIGLGGITVIKHPNKESLCFFFSLLTPFFYYSFDRLFRFLSYKIYKRDFFLWIKHSDEIDNSLFALNPHIKALDVIFSISLLIIIVTLLLTIILASEQLSKDY